jgi:hypothetical protein
MYGHVFACNCMYEFDGHFPTVIVCELLGNISFGESLRAGGAISLFHFFL